MLPRGDDRINQNGRAESDNPLGLGDDLADISATETSDDASVASTSSSDLTERATQSSQDSEDLSSGSARPTSRPNRYHGPISTWREWTKEERLLSSSLVQQRAADLSIHLYNAHALKTRLREPSNAVGGPSWTTKESWINTTQDTRESGSTTDSFYPNKRWTAWPMPADIVPREGEMYGYREDEADKRWTYKRQEKERPSRLLEELITAAMLKAAKERFESREWEESTQGVEPGERETSRPSTVISTPGNSQPVIKRDNQSDEDVSTIPPQTSRQAEKCKPTVMADDEEARVLLRPTVRHILSKFDDLLMGLHHARQASLATSDAPQKAKKQDKANMHQTLPPNNRRSSTLERKRGRGRPKKALEMGDVLHPLAQTAAEADNSTSTGTKPRKKMGRPMKYRKPVEGETYYMMRRRMLEGQASNSKAEQAPPVSHSNSDGSDSADSPNRILRDHHTTRQRRRRQLGLRDWSDVVGIASMTGWNVSITSRTAQRCATLFDEGIRFRTLHEEKARFPRLQYEEAKTVEEYKPALSVSQAMSSAETTTTTTTPTESESSNEEDVDSDDNDTKGDTTHLPTPPLQARICTLPSGRRTFLCPLSTCNRYVGPGFKDRWYVRRHLQGVHGGVQLDDRRVESSITASGNDNDNGNDDEDEDEDEMWGGVHVDGFLKPIPSPPRSRTRSRPRSDKRKKKQKKKTEETK